MFNLYFVSTVLLLFVYAALGSSGLAGETSNLATNLKAKKPQTIVTYGTSLTEAGAWVWQLRKTLNEQYPGLTTVINSGKSAMSSQWGVGNLEERVLKKKPDAVFIEFAINDAWVDSNSTVVEARQNLENMLDRILKANPACEIILMTMNPPIGEHLKVRPNIKDYYQMYRDVAQKRKLALVDHHTQWQELLQKDEALFRKYVPDGIHPNAEGCEKVITPGILKTLGLGPDMEKDVKSDKTQP